GHHHLLFDLNVAALLHLQRLDLARRVAGVGDEAEGQLGGGADEFLQLRRVLQSRHLDQHAIGALALDVGFLGARGVEATVEHLDRLRDGAPHLVVDGRVGQRHPYDAVIVGDTQQPAARAPYRAADRLIEGLEQLQRLGALGGFGDAHDNAAWLHADAAGQRDLGLAQLGAHVVAQLLDLALDELVLVDLHQQMRSALQVQAEGDGPRRQPRRQRAFQRRDGGWLQEARNDEQDGDGDHREYGDDLPSGDAQHLLRSFGGRSGWRILAGLAARTHIGDAGADEADAQVGREFQLDLAVVDGFGDLADEAAARHHDVAALGRLHHQTLLLGALLLRPQNEKVHDDEDDDEG